MEHSFFTLSRFSSRDGWAISPTCCRSSKAEVNTLLADQKDLWQQEQWTAAPGGSLDFSPVVVKFKSDAAQLKRCTRLQQCVRRTKHRAIGSPILVDNAGAEATVASRRDGAGAAAVVGIEAASSGVDGRRKGGR